MASILSFIKPPYAGLFDPDMTRVMGEALDAVRNELGNSSTTRNFEDAAHRIIEAARGGERDLGRLIQAGLGARVGH